MNQNTSRILRGEAVDVALHSVEEVIGTAGIRSVLQHAKLEDYFVDGKVPHEKQITFAQIGQVTQSFIDIFGVRGAGAILRRTGRVQFDKWNEAYPTALGAAGVALKALPPLARVKTTLGVVKLAAKQIVNVETAIEQKDGQIYFATFHCPYCAGVSADKPFCLTAVGAFEALTKWATGETWLVKEATCRAMGAQACVFRLTPPTA